MPYVYAHTRARPLGARLRSSHLGATSTDLAAFRDAISNGRAALVELAVLGATLERAAWDPGTAEAGRLAKVFATDTGPRLLSEAEAATDPLKVARVQGATDRITAALKPDVVPAVITRFIVMTIPLVGPLVATRSADQIDAAKEAGRSAMEAALPTFLTDREQAEKVSFYIKAALALGGIVAIAYALNTLRGFVPKSDE